VIDPSSGAGVSAQLIELARNDPEVWWMSFATIKNKEAKLVRPKSNILQKRIFAYYRECVAMGVACLFLVIKPRQTGASTGIQGLIYHHMRRHKNLNGALMGDIQATSDKVFDIFARYARNDRFPWGDSKMAGISEKDDGVEDIVLASGSSYHKETAGSKNAGRSGTVQVANMTEVAWFENAGGIDPTLAFLNSFHNSSTVSLGAADTTPNGPKGWAYRQTRARNSRWKVIFAAWYEFEDFVLAFKSERERQEFEESMSIEERETFERLRSKGVTLEHMNWRRDTIVNKCDGDVDKFRQEYPESLEDGFMRSARPRFDVGIVAEMAEAAAAVHPERGTLALHKDGKVTWHRDAAGSTRIFEEPKYGLSYIVSADTMTGEDQVDTGETADPDYHDIQVWRAEYLDEVQGVLRTKKLVARHRSRLDIDLAAREAYCLSVHYGDALIVPEVNNSGLAMLKELQRLGANIYRRRRVDTTTKREIEQLGWRTDGITRKTIIDGLAKELRNRNAEIPDLEVVQELQTFVLNKNGKAEAMSGAHDDAVLAAAIAVENIGAASKREMPKRGTYSRSRLLRNPGLGAPEGFVRTRYAHR
jgi:hypothetical protein